MLQSHVTEEEEGDSCSDSSENGTSKVKKQSDPFHRNDGAQACARIEFLTRQVATAIEESERLPQAVAADILTPPPDYL